MRTIFFILLLPGFFASIKSQTGQSLSQVITAVSEPWKQDSNSCKGYRLQASKDMLTATVDRVSKEFILSHLGKPNKIEKFYSGITNKNYVGYIYFIYKDDCPKMRVEAQAIQFAFEDTEPGPPTITVIDYCE